jgi:hypothetical protein
VLQQSVVKEKTAHSLNFDNFHRKSNKFQSKIIMPINHRALGRTEGKPEDKADKENVPQMSYLANYKAFPDFVQDKEIHILLEDQQKINQFARLNNRLEEFKDDITAKKTEIQTLEDASTDMMMLEDDDEKIPYQIGEVFVSFDI